MSESWKPSPQQMLCRDLQHAWEPSSASRTHGGYIRRLICERCGTWKVQVLDADGYIMSSSMSYPKGYVRLEGGRLTKAERAEIRKGNMS